MLDVAGLPKNSNGFRTTHTCELCGFEPKTKNKYREKQDHLVMKHFKERIDKIFPHCRPYSCPNSECEFAGKDKQALLRHYTGKHGVLELFLREALQERGISYHLSDAAKRKSIGNMDSSHRDGGLKECKLGRLSPPMEETLLPAGSPEGPVFADSTHVLPNEFPDLREPVPSFQQQPMVSVSQTRIPTQLPTLPSQPTTKLPSMASVLIGNTRPNPTKAEVDLMLASFQPQLGQTNYQIATTELPPQPSTSPLHHEVSSTTMEFFPSPFSAETSKLILNDNIMWGGGNSAQLGGDSCLPHQTYLETSVNQEGFVNLGDIDYDYLYPATVDPSTVQPPPQAVGGEQHRLLSFSML
jgi:hypothetical protein